MSTIKKFRCTALGRSPAEASKSFVLAPTAETIDAIADLNLARLRNRTFHRTRNGAIEVKAFAYEHTHRFTEKEYIQVAAVLSRKPRPRVRRAVIVLLIGIGCLFSPYTMLLGVLVILASTFGAVAPRFVKGTVASTFRESRFLKEETTYGVSERGLWVRSPYHSGWASWEMLGYWRIRGDWLMLPCQGIPTVFLPVSELQAAGVFEQVMDRVRAHGTPYDGEAAQYAQGTTALAT